jgi:hypothetical protein
MTIFAGILCGMRSRGVRRLTFAILLLAGVAAAALTWDLQRKIAANARTAADVHVRLDRMLETISQIGAAQQGYVALGQQDEPWLARASSLLQQLHNDIGSAGTESRSAGAPATLAVVRNAATGLVQFDAQLRENLRLGEELIAADLIFADGRATLDGIASQLAELREAEEAAFAAERDALGWQMWTTVGGVAALWLLGLALLVRVPAPRQEAAAPTVVERHEPTIDILPAPEPVAPARATIDLAAVADVCTAIARMTAAGELPTLLGRAAVVLDASGVIVWLSAGEELFAVVSHGYDPRIIARLGPIGGRAENATAASWRSGEVKVVPGTATSPGAIVAPMVGPDACIGVLSAEVKHGREHDADARAVTAMIAAQLAMIVSGWPAASNAPSEAPPAAAASS